ncbi:MAG TPA: hypothetical protein VLY21_03455 [Nitrososphaerales archaeon]|nr:hypothetical protein [Nitrososphaerales archaeon]
MSEDTVDDGFSSAKERVAQAYQASLDDAKAKVESARAEALRKLGS